DQSYRPPVTQEFSMNLQTQMRNDYLLEIAYVGARGTHQILNRSLNQALFASASNPVRGITTNTTANIAQRVPILGFTAPGLNDIDSSASSWYHGLEVSLTKRLSKGLQFLVARLQHQRPKHRGRRHLRHHGRPEQQAGQLRPQRIQPRAPAGVEFPVS